jgi:dTDP-4-dehydrorhamnose 3,5-epimerase-like enzyme
MSQDLSSGGYPLNRIEGVVVREMPYYEDARGWLLKAVPNDFIGEDTFGEIYLSAAAPGEVKGAHYHNDTTEWFCVIRGEGTLHMEDVLSGNDMKVTLTGGNHLSVEIPPRVAHAIVNNGNEEMILLAYADLPYDPDHPDTVPWHFNIS